MGLPVGHPPLGERWDEAPGLARPNHGFHLHHRIGRRVHADPVERFLFRDRDHHRPVEVGRRIPAAPVPVGHVLGVVGVDDGRRRAGGEDDERGRQGEAMSAPPQHEEATSHKRRRHHQEDVPAAEAHPGLIDRQRHEMHEHHTRGRRRSPRARPAPSARPRAKAPAPSAGGSGRTRARTRAPCRSSRGPRTRCAARPPRRRPPD